MLKGLPVCYSGTLSASYGCALLETPRFLRWRLICHDIIYCDAMLKRYRRREVQARDCGRQDHILVMQIMNVLFHGIVHDTQRAGLRSCGWTHRRLKTSIGDTALLS